MLSSIKHYLGNGVQEIRFAFSQNANNSNSLRQFVASNYPQLKSFSPSFPILIRESANAQPKITARFDYGVERSISTDELSVNDIEQKFVELLNQAQNMPKSDESKQDKKLSS